MILVLETKTRLDRHLIWQSKRVLKLFICILFSFADQKATHVDISP